MAIRTIRGASKPLSSEAPSSPACALIEGEIRSGCRHHDPEGRRPMALVRATGALRDEWGGDR